MVAVDHLTSYVVTATSPTGSLANIANSFVKDILLKHGASRVLISDRRRPLLAQLLHDVLAACSIGHKLPSVEFSPFRLLYRQDPLSSIDIIFPYMTPSDNFSLPDATYRFEEC